MRHAFRGRKDLKPVTSFLSTRVQDYNEEDYCKLRRLVNYIYTTKYNIALINADDIGVLHTFIDESYVVHPNKRIHTDGAMLFLVGG